MKSVNDRYPRLSTYVCTLCLVSLLTGSLAAASLHGAESRAALQAAVERNPRDRRCRLALARALSTAGRFEELLVAALDWQRYDERNPLVYEFLAEAYGACGDDRNALRSLTAVGEVKPSSAALCCRAGYLMLKAGKLEMAQTFFRHAVTTWPKECEGHRGLALTAWSAGDFQEAAAAYEKLSAVAGSSWKTIVANDSAQLFHCWLRAEPLKKLAIEKRRSRAIGNRATVAPLMVTVHWDTTADDVDLSVVDPAGEPCNYWQHSTKSGLRYETDHIAGHGPEIVTCHKPFLTKGNYAIDVTFFTAGPSGATRGYAVILRQSATTKPDLTIAPFFLVPRRYGRGRDKRHLTSISVD